MIGRLGGILRRSDGSILIADAAAHELRIFDDSGRFLRRAGGPGQGPGEYNWLTHVLPHAADSIAVMDGEGGRATILGPDLAFARRYRPRLVETRATYPMTSHSLIGYFDDGSLAVSDYLNVCGPRRMEGFCEDSVAFYRVDEDGNVLARFGSYVYSRDESQRGEVNVSVYEPYPQAFWTVRGSRFYYADAKRFEVLVFRKDGSLERVMRVAEAAPGYSRDDIFPPPPVASAEGAPQQDARMVAARRQMSLLHASLQMPDSFPAFSDLLVDEVGNVWLREYLPAPILSTRAPRWFIFDSEGRLSHAIRSPSFLVRARRSYTDMHPQIGADFILATSRDENGVESVVLHRLTRR
jgi:hypothetical protein